MSSPSTTTGSGDLFDKVFNDPKLVNIVATDLSAIEAVSELCESVKTFLRKAKDNEKIAKEALEKNQLINDMISSSSFRPCFRDETFVQDLIRRRENLWNNIRNMDRMYEEPYSSCSLMCSISLAMCFCPKKICIASRRIEMMGLMSGKPFLFGSIFTVMQASMRNAEQKMKSMKSEGMKHGDDEKLKMLIEDLQNWVNHVEQCVEESRVMLKEMLVEFFTHVKTCKLESRKPIK